MDYSETDFRYFLKHCLEEWNSEFTFKVLKVLQASQNRAFSENAFLIEEILAQNVNQTADLLGFQLVGGEMVPD